MKEQWTSISVGRSFCNYAFNKDTIIMAYPHCLLVNLQFKLLLILEFEMDRTTLLSAERLKKRKNLKSDEFFCHSEKMYCQWTFTVGFTIASRRLKFTKWWCLYSICIHDWPGSGMLLVMFYGAKDSGPGLWMSHSVSFCDSHNFALSMWKLSWHCFPHSKTIFFRMVRKDHLIHHSKLNQYQLQTCWKSLSWKRN